jgi:hypothetical protein
MNHGSKRSISCRNILILFSIVVLTFDAHYGGMIPLKILNLFSLSPQRCLQP